ncbi:MAG: helix-turn-helix domain-containing protein [Parabacteroides sp.]|nr:helix-turn-helix domain-containing protein [Parabacteroides sp.]
MRNLLYNAQNGDSDATIILVEKFKPLIKKYATQLNYYCAETDLVIALLELISSIDINKFKDGCDGEIVNYIYITLRNKKIDLYRKSKLHAIEEIHIEPETFTHMQTNGSLNITSPMDWTSILNGLSEK